MVNSLVIGMVILALFGGYVFTSLLLLRFPTLIHEKKKNRIKCRHISHRGGAGENLENTMAAFLHAKSMHTDMLEIDCQLTRDGQVVISHDNNLIRTTGHNVNVSDVDFRDLPLLKEELGVDFAKSQRTRGGGDRRIPLLSELYQQFPQVSINVDIKVDNDDLISKVSALTKQFDRESITVWGNRSDVVGGKCYRENPNMPLIFSLKKVLQTTALFYLGLLPFVPLKASYYEILMPDVLSEVFRSTSGMKGLILVKIIDFLLMSKVLFRHLHRRGIPVYLWVINEEKDFDRAFRLGATGIMTDYPTKLRQFLEEHPHYACKDSD